MSVCFTSRKIAFKRWLNTSSIASYLSSFLSFFLSQSHFHLDTWWIDRDWVCMLDSFSIPGGSIKLLLLILMSWSSIPPRHLSCRRAFPRHLLDRSLDTCICRDLLASLYKASARSGSHFHRSLSRYFSVSLPKTLSSHSKLVSQGFFKVFQVFLYLVSFQSFFIHAFHVLKPRFWSFWKILGFFKIDELSLKFWVGFSLKCV